VEAALEEEAGFVPVTLSAPFARSDLVDRFHQLGRVEQTMFDEVGTTLLGYLPQRELGRFAPYVVARDDEASGGNGRVTTGVALDSRPASAGA
jgi:hypothetical protein